MAYQTEKMFRIDGLKKLYSIDDDVEFTLDDQSDGNSISALDIYVSGPSGKRKKCAVTCVQNINQISFTPTEIGEWQIFVEQSGQQVHGSPFKCHVFDANSVAVNGLDVGLVGKELAFTVDTRRAGPGVIDVNILRQNDALPCRVTSRDTNVYDVRFTPDGAAHYKIHVTFNGCDVKGSPFILDIADALTVSVSGEQLRMAAVGRVASFFINANVEDSRDITVIVTGPSKKEKYARIIPLDMSTFKAEFKPIETGEHRIAVLVNDVHIAESPFTCNVGDPDLVTVKRIPEIIKATNLNTPHFFEIDATAAGSGNLEIIINGGRIACRVWETSPRRFQAQFTPIQPIRHTVEMKFNGEHVLNSPWQIPFQDANGRGAFSPRAVSPRTISPRAISPRAVSPLFTTLGPNESYSELIGQGLRCAAVGQISSFEIKSDTLKIGNMIIRLFDFDGRELDVKIIEKSHSLRCEYTIRKVGEYRLEIYINGRLIDAGALFVAGYDPAAIRVRPVSGFFVGEPVKFTVDAVEAGKGQLEISVNQGRVPNNVQMQDAGRCLVTFIPQHSGTYVIDVTFNGQQVHGCPIKVDVQTRQVGKPVSAPVYSQVTGGTVVGSTSPLPGRGSSAMERGPSSSAYFSASSPRGDFDTTAYTSPTSAYGGASPPRSPPMVRHVTQRSAGGAILRESSPSAGIDTERLRSPRLVQSVVAEGGTGASVTEASDLVGYTVAKYGAGEPAGYERDAAYGRGRPTESAQMEMTRSAELSLSRSSLQQQIVEQNQSPLEDVRNIFDTGKTYKRFESVSSEPPLASAASSANGGVTHQQFEADEYAAACAAADAVAAAAVFGADATLQDHSSMSRYYYQSQKRNENEKEIGDNDRQTKMSRNIYDEIPATTDGSAGVRSIRRTPDLVQTPLKIDESRKMADTVEYTHVVDPHSSQIEALTPSTRRKLMEHSVFKAADLKESEQSSDVPTPESMMRQSAGGAHADESRSSAPSSRHSSKPTTPRLSLKFGRIDNNKNATAKDSVSGGAGGGPRGFDFGKSKITSKNEVVRRGKEVEVKVESLKLSKDDQLKVVVMAPARKGQMAASPSGEALVPPEVPHRVKKSRNTYEITFRPTEVGTHKVLVFVNNQFPHPQTPFPIRVYDASEILVGDIRAESAVNDTVEFTVDAGRAGFGNLEMAIKDSDQCIIPSHVSQLEVGTAKFLVTFNPTSVGVHTVNITFNKEVIKGSPFEVNVVEYLPGTPYTPTSGDSAPFEVKKREKSKEKRDKKSHRSSSSSAKLSQQTQQIQQLEERQHGQQQQQQQGLYEEPRISTSNGNVDAAERAPTVSRLSSLSRVGRPAEVVVLLPTRDARLDGHVLDCEKEPVASEIVDASPTDAADATAGGVARCLRFVPTRVGDHQVTLLVDGVPLAGSPFTCRAYDPTGIVVGAIPDGRVGRPVHFTVDAAAVGVGNLEVAVNNGKIPSMAHALGQHRYDISFVPREPIDHYISVHFNNERVPGSPFVCRLTAPANGAATNYTIAGPALERVPVGQPVEFWVTIPEDEELETVEVPEVEILDSRGEQLVANVARDARDSTRFVVTYTPRFVGNHQIEVRCGGEPLMGSPFTSKAFDASAARLILDDVGGGGGALVGRPCTFLIDAAKAGAGNMEIIVSVGKRNVPNFVTAEGQAKFKVSFTPQEATDHIISVKFNGIPIPGSPMRCPVAASAALLSPAARRHNESPTPPSRRAASGDESAPPQPPPSQRDEVARLTAELATAAVGRVKRFSVAAPADASRAADCNVIVTGPRHARDRLPVEVVLHEGNDRFFQVEFTPRQSDAFDANHATNVDDAPPYASSTSPCDVRIVAFPNRALVERRAQFDVEVVRGAEKGLRIDILDPQGNSLPVDLRRVADSTGEHSRRDDASLWRQRFTAEWEPRREGVHLVQVHLDGERLSAAQLFPNAVDEENVDENEAEDPDDAKDIRSNGRTFEEEGREITAGKHKEDRLQVRVLDPSAVHVIGLRDNGHCDEELEFQLDWLRSGGTQIRVEIRHEDDSRQKHAQQRRIASESRVVRRGVSACRFRPTLPGLYFIDIFLDEIKLPECPYECTIMGRAESRTAAPPPVAAPFYARGGALNVAWRGRVASFDVVRVAGGRASLSGDLDVVISDSRRGPLPVRCFRQHDGSYTVEFTPEQIGSHKIDVTFADVPLSGSPFCCEVVDPTRVTLRGVDDALAKRAVATLIVNRVNAGAGELALELLDPQGTPLRLNHLRAPSGEDMFTFVPSKLGLHTLNATLGGFSLPGTPRTLIVEEPSRPCIYGAALDYACVVGQQASLIFDAKRANGGLKVEVRFEEPDATPTGAGGAKLRHTIDKRANGTTEIAFRPTRVGFYRVSVEFNNAPVSGSPYRVAVVDPECVAVRSDALYAPDAGDGMLRLRAGVTTAIDVDATKAGPGSLRVEARGVSGIARVSTADVFTDALDVRVHNVGFGKWRVEVRPTQTSNSVADEPQLFKLYFYWAELVVPSAYPLVAIVDAEHLPSPPSRLPNSPQSNLPATPKSTRTYKTTIVEREDYTNGHRSDAPAETLATAAAVASRVQLDGDGVVRALLKESTEFLIDASGESSLVDVAQFYALLAGERADVPIRIATTPRANVFKCTYTPLVVGRYELSVRYMDVHVHGSPSTVDVRGYSTPAELIKVDTKTLKIGIIGEDVKTIIDARQAKSGNLSAQCASPTQAEYCELFDNRDGTYILRVTPKELGRHTLAIRYAGEHVPGSPFTFNVANPPDPGQVRVYGPGIEHGILHSYKSNFIVETKGAGAGQLTIRVRGPKGAFNVEMQRDRQHDRTIHCKYEPREPGDYQVEVKWHGQHVPGSPFFVIIVDTEEELHRFLAGGAPSPSPATPFVPPGWTPTSGAGGGHPPPPLGVLPPPPHLVAPPHMLPPPPPSLIPPHHHHHHHHPLNYYGGAPPPHSIYGARHSPRGQRY